MKRTSIIAAAMILSLFLLQRQMAAEVHIFQPESVLTGGIDSLSDQEACEFVIADIDAGIQVRISEPQDLYLYRNSNSEAAPLASHLLVKAANKGMALRNNILLKLRI
jgi:hypothetical protein